MNRRELFSSFLFAPVVAAFVALRPRVDGWLVDGVDDTFSLETVDAAVEAAKELTPAIMPVVINGKRYYVWPVRNHDLLDYIRHGDYRVW